MSRFSEKSSLHFTLIELLVVISIIGVLAGMLLPSLSSARARGESTTCQNNLKQMGSGFIAYANDFKGMWPTGVVSYNKGSSCTDTYNASGSEHRPAVAFLTGALTTNRGKDYYKSGSYPSYISNTKIGYCPISIDPSCKKTWDRGDTCGRGYGVRWLREAGDTEFLGYTTTLWEPDGSKTNVKQETIVFKPFKCPVSSSVFFMGDNIGWNDSAGVWDMSSRITSGANLSGSCLDNPVNGAAIYIVHGKLANYLYIDGHVGGISNGDSNVTNYGCSRYYNRDFAAIDWGK